jgi:hypothetical protein
VQVLNFKKELRILKHITLIFLSSLLLNACGSDSPDCMKSTGKITKEQRTVTPYNIIHVSGNLNLIFTADTTGIIIVEAGEHLQKKIKTEVVDGRLNISNHNTCNWVRSYKEPRNIYIGIKNATNIFHYGPGLISTEARLTKDSIFIHLYSNGSINLNLDSKYIWLDMDNLGDFILTGKTETLWTQTLGIGQLNSEGMSCKNCFIKNTGQGDAFVRSDSLLTHYIENSGNVYYSGSPVVIYGGSSGKGQLIKK